MSPTIPSHRNHIEISSIGRDKDVASGTLMVKIAERRATLLGLNPLLGHAVHIVQHEPANRSTTHDRIRAAIDRRHRAAASAA